MLQRILPPTPAAPSLPIASATSPTPFPKTLEYSPAARGTWNIVHTGMLLPESHQIYICASGCLRGVILTAAEMGESYYRRFHTLELQETDLYATDPETFLIEGITNILHRLPKLPPAVLTFTACVHHFLGCNLPYVYRTLRHRFPSVQFAECIMDPIRQTKSMPPETRERLEIARLLKKSPLPPEVMTAAPSDREQSDRLRDHDRSDAAASSLRDHDRTDAAAKRARKDSVKESSVESGGPSLPPPSSKPPFACSINLLGSNLPLNAHSDIAQILRRHNLRLRDFPTCRTYAEFQQMAASRANLYTNPQTRLAAEDLEHRLHQPSLYLPPAWTYQEIQQNLERLETFLQDILALTPEATEPPSQPHPSELPLPTSATPPAAHAALPPLRGGLRSENSEQSKHFRPLGAPCSAKTGHPSGERGLCDSERSGEHPSGAEKNRNATLKTAPTAHLESHEIAREDSPLSESAQSPRPTATSNAPSRPSLDLRERLALLELRFESLRSQLEDTPLALDSTFTPLPFSLARLLVSHHLSVTEIYADTIAPDDEQNFRWLQRCAPSIRLYPTKHPAMRTQPREHLDASGRLPIALGQKAAYFTGTHHFLPEIEAGGHYGLEAIHWLQTALSRAALLETDPEPILKKKAWGAPSCI